MEFGKINIRKNIKSCLIAAVFAVGFFALNAKTADAAELYISNTGVKISGTSIQDDWSDQNCYPNLQAAIGQMAGGDTLVVDDGTYIGAENTIVYGVNVQLPSRTESSYTTVRARNYGDVVIDGEGLRKLVYLTGRNYIHFDGIVFKNAGNGGLAGEIFSVIGALDNYAHHIKVTRCGFSEVPDTTTINNRFNLFFVRYVEYFLVEDCYAWGNGKYRYYILDSRNGVLRRNLDRIDRATSDGEANFASVRLYNSSNIEVQNHLVIDSDQRDQYIDAGLPNKIPHVIFSDAGGGVTSSNKVVGAIGINNPGLNVWFHNNDDDINTDILENSVFWNFAQAIRNRENDPPDQMSIRNCVFGNMHDYITAYPSRVYSEDGYSIRIRSSLLYNIDIALQSDLADSDFSDFNVFYANTDDYGAYAEPGVHDISNIDPFNNSILYPIRTESESDLAGIGENGSDIGADIQNKIGVSGTIYGEVGYNTQTNDPLWPWPHEDVIKNHLSQYDLHGIDGQRGFCAPEQTLTKYVWEYLGNQIPTEIYGVSADLTPPSAPGGLLVN